MSIVPFEPGHADGFRSLVADTLREFGFEPDPALDADLDDPAATYAALWVALDDGRVVGSVALRDLGEDALELKRMYLRQDQRGRGLGKELLAPRARLGARARDAGRPTRHERADGRRPAPVRGIRIRTRRGRRSTSGAVPPAVRVASGLAQRDDALALCAGADERDLDTERLLDELDVARAPRRGARRRSAPPSRAASRRRAAMVEIALVRRELVRLAAVAQPVRDADRYFGEGREDVELRQRE